MKNKKGISEIVSYVILIMIAISLSIIVYVFIKTLVAPPVKTCPEGISVSLQDYSCSLASDNKTITLEIYNDGRFNLSAILVKAKPSENSQFICPLTGKYYNGQQLVMTAGPETGFVFFKNTYVPGTDLKTESSGKLVLDYSLPTTTVPLCRNMVPYEIELIPVRIFPDGSNYICTTMSRTQKISCA